MGFFDKISNLWRRGSPKPTIQTEQSDRPDATPLTHSTDYVRQDYYLYEMLRVEMDRRSILQDVEKLLQDDPLIDETNMRIARKAVRGGIIVTVTGSGKHLNKQARLSGMKAGRGGQLQNRAQQIIDEFMKRVKLEANARLFIARMISDGDLFQNIVVELHEDGYRIASIRWAPPAIMKRNENEFGEFIDLNRAFSEIDPLRGVYSATVIPDDAVRHFPLWSINHVRWKYRGGLYGNSQYVSIRKLSKQNQAADDDMRVARKVRAPLRRSHTLGTPEFPAEPHVVEEYKQKHQDAIVNGKYLPTTDYYNNGAGRVENLEGDPNLDKIGDVVFQYNKENIGTIMPKGLVGFSEDINRDVLDEQKQEADEVIEDIRHVLENGDGGPFSGLRAIIDFELLLHGIDVEALGLKYDISFQPLKTETPSDVINRAKQARDAKLIDRRTAVNSVAHLFNVEDPDLIIQALDEEAQQAQSKVPGDNHDGAGEQVQEE